ncbi:chemotaxis protein CheW [Paenibacillus sp. YN15]|uniref:chemotaxis protein CheW n=1 Tax=Paenibacillus sp. YN15 TaxID=1742774 RepID=UPI000DCD64CA|nr:chemotaxis protein CheW [Paenibacillus sp. YN15]RAU97674.1 chemotaxis protein CheW [Paenibacillus sp. YN15]
MQAVLKEQYVQFSIHEENYSIRISGIHEIIRMQTITSIPNSPGYLKGVINLRGAIIPVISLRSLFLMEEVEPTKASRIIVVNYRDKPMGIVVDKVDKVVVFSKIHEAPSQYGSGSMACISGIGIAAGELVGIIDLDKMLLET